MSKVGQRERKTQDRIVKLFQNTLKYTYLGNWEDVERSSPVEEENLRKFITKNQKHTPILVNRAIEEFKKVSGNQTKSLYDLNKDTYGLLRYGIQVKEDAGDTKKTVHLIDWANPEENDFAIAEEVTVRGENTKRPDVVLYINGIAIAVLELKRSTISVSEGIRQNLDNQKSIFIKPFFATIQLVMAGNDTEGLRYGTIETPEKYFLTWKERGETDTSIDRHLSLLCEKKRILEIIHDFIVFDRGIKKIPRHHQYFGVKAAEESVRRREGGIIWHSQGSGKSLTMIWLAKWIRENIPDSRVLVITDRDELDKQIEKVFTGVSETIYRTKSGRDLVEKLNATTPFLLCSLIHKFGRNEEPDYDSYLEELISSLPKDFKAKGDIYVLVDECHRTQSGKLHKAMTTLLPHAMLIGFTGTPLLRKDKQKSIEIFGPYIDTYKFDEAVADKVVLDLRYEARKIDQHITSPAKIDKWFEAKTKGLTDFAKTELKKRWGTLQKVLSSQDRLSKIVGEIMFDMATKDRLQNGRGNAMLVSGSIYQACKYYELFINNGFTKCAIVTSYKPSKNDIKGESTGEEELTERLRQYEIYNKMLAGKDPEEFEEEVKKKFTDEPAQMKLLIVVDKLLTGFDAPAATYLYIDKSMQDHGLFQAICRVNRLDGEDKQYGYVIDYKDLFKSLERSINDYTSEAFDDYDPEDVEGLLNDRLEQARERLDNALESIKILCEPVVPPYETKNYLDYFCGDNLGDENQVEENEQKRVTLYKLTSSLIRAYAEIANEMPEVGYSAKETEEIIADVKHYETVRAEVKLASGDYIDLKAYEPAMRHLIDAYVGAGDGEVISAFDDLTLVEMIVKSGVGAIDNLPKGIRKDKQAVAETIENNVRKLIVDEKPTNPKYFEKMSVLLDEVIKARRAEVLNYEEYLRKICELAKKVKNPESTGTYPSSLNSPGKRALYDNLDNNADLAMAVHEDVMSIRKADWRDNLIKEREVKAAINKHVSDDERAEQIFKVVKKQYEY
jgi:type I restriction enzyme R subunit